MRPDPDLPDDLLLASALDRTAVGYGWIPVSRHISPGWVIVTYRRPNPDDDDRREQR